MPSLRNRYMIVVPAFLALFTQGCQSAASSSRPAQLMVYKGGGCDGRRKMPAFNSFLGRPADGVLAFMQIRSWREMRGTLVWGLKCWDDQPYQLALGVPMVTKGANFAAGAKGAYDEEFKRIAEKLVSHKRADAYIRIGWEFNGDWYPWTAKGRPELWKTYFRRIAQIFRETPGGHFRIVWNPGLGEYSIAPDLAYPGDDVVDVIGVDFYNRKSNPVDVDPQVRWARYLAKPYGLDWVASFAREHGKPIAIPEWGTGTKPDGSGAGDDPYFIARVGEWIRNNNVVFHGYWDYPASDYNALMSDGAQPKVASEFKRQFGKPDEARGSPAASSK